MYLQENPKSIEKAPKSLRIVGNNELFILVPAYNTQHYQEKTIDLLSK